MRRHTLDHTCYATAILWTCLVFQACTGGGSGRTNANVGIGGSTPTGPTTTPGTSTTPLPEETVPKVTAAGLTLGNPSLSNLYTSEAGENGCTTVKVTATDSAGKLLPKAQVTATTQTTAKMEDPGTVTLSPEDGLTGDDGTIDVSYCSGKSAGQVLLVIKSGNLTKNTGRFTLTPKPVYEFKYLKSDLDPLTSSSGAKADPDTVYLNLFDQGPDDCTKLTFQLTRSGQPLAAEPVRFRTQVDFPKGSKLALRGETGVTATDTATQRKYAIRDMTSEGNGTFKVPVCAGVSLGSLTITAQYTDPEQTVHTAQSPVVRVVAGLVNAVNLSLTFDPKNGRTLRAYYNTNSDYELPFSVELGGRYDGNPITDYAIFAASEAGRITLANDGNIAVGNSKVDVKLRALHLSDNYPFLVYPKTVGGNYERVFRNGTTLYSAAQTRCDPQELAAWAKNRTTPVTSVPYKDLKNNWRSTFVYGIRGQEHFNDANRNGKYDVGGWGFWDKNQNGVCDGNDVITTDATKTCADLEPNSEWFIDLPTPFVDTDENGAFDPIVDILLGDEYVAPNGKRDSDTLVWKSEYFPVSMGPSPYGLQRRQIFSGSTAPAGIITASNGYDSLEPLFDPSGNIHLKNSGISTKVPLLGWHMNAADNTPSGGYSLIGSDFWSSLPPGTDQALLSNGRYRYVVFAHDLCGNLLPGGTNFEMAFVAIHAPEYGARNPVAMFYMQEPDVYLEPARRLLREASGSKAVINFNAVEHQSQQDSYPVLGNIEIPACFNLCTGEVDTPGLACDGWSGFAQLTAKEPSLDSSGQSENIAMKEVYLQFPAIKTCDCIPRAEFSKGVCACPSGTSNQGGGCCVEDEVWNGTTCVTLPP